MPYLIALTTTLTERTSITPYLLAAKRQEFWITGPVGHSRRQRATGAPTRIFKSRKTITAKRQRRVSCCENVANGGPGPTRLRRGDTAEDWGRGGARRPGGKVKWRKRANLMCLLGGENTWDQSYLKSQSPLSIILHILTLSSLFHVMLCLFRDLGASDLGLLFSGGEGERRACGSWIIFSCVGAGNTHC